MVKELERALGRGQRSRDAALALSIGAAAIDEGLIDVALEHLAWAKHEAARVAPVREAYGVALYLDERYAEALTELQAYRRLSGRNDQNHLVADCLRGLGRDLDQVVAVARELGQDTAAPEDRRAEAVVVWAAALADAQRPAAGLAVLRTALEELGHDEAAEHVLAMRSVLAELAARTGDHVRARRELQRIVEVEPGFADAERRLAELPG